MKWAVAMILLFVVLFALGLYIGTHCCKRREVHLKEPEPSGPFEGGVDGDPGKVDSADDKKS